MHLYVGPITNSRVAVLLGWLCAFVGFVAFLLLLAAASLTVLGLPSTLQLSIYALVIPLLIITVMFSLLALPADSRHLLAYTLATLKRARIYLEWGAFVAILLGVYLLAIDWPSVAWSKPALYAAFVSQLLVIVLFAICLAATLHFQLGYVFFLRRQTRGWNRGVWENWSESDFAQSPADTDEFWRWPEPQT